MNVSEISSSIEKQKNRIDWIDVCKAFAILFIYFGHWLTKNGNLAVFAYSFHLQLFFLLSGFFAVNQQKRKSWFFVKNQFNILFIPFIFFSILNIIYFNMDGEKTLKEISLNFYTNFTDFSHSVSAELWFLPSLFCVSLSYFFLLRLLKKPLFILALAYLLYIIQTCYSDNSLGLVLTPFVEFIGISSIPTYLFWYSLGSFSFPYIKIVIGVIEGRSSQIKYLIVSTGVFLFLITVLIYLFKPDAFWNRILLMTHSSKVINNIFVMTNFRIVTTLMICFTFILLSYVFRNSGFLLLIGKNTIILLGFEFIIKNFLVLNFFPMLNLGVIKLDSTVQVITISIIMVLCVIPLFKPFNKHIPYLIGKR